MEIEHFVLRTLGYLIYKVSIYPLLFLTLLFIFFINPKWVLKLKDWCKKKKIDFQFYNL